MPFQSTAAALRPELPETDVDLTQVISFFHSLRNLSVFGVLYNDILSCWINQEQRLISSFVAANQHSAQCWSQRVAADVPVSAPPDNLPDITVMVDWAVRELSFASKLFVCLERVIRTWSGVMIKVSCLNMPLLIAQWFKKKKKKLWLLIAAF